MTLLFTPFQQKSLTLANRIVMSPMCMYSAGNDGKATDWHLVHYGTRAIGGVGLIILEATAVEARGRISPRDLGLWDDSQIEPLKRIVDFVHEQKGAIGIQLAHAGRKAEVEDEIVAPSALPFNQDSPIPHELSKDEILSVIDSWRQAARRANEAGFDVIEIHGAHGYLIHEFLSPISNQRTDEYGGSLENRCLFLKQIIQAVREEWPKDKPIYLRLSAVDYDEGGITLEDTIAIAAIAKNEGIDLIDCSSGGISDMRPPAIYPGYQIPYAAEIRKKVGIPTGCVGLITESAMANEILGNKKADLVFLGRELLRNPYWALYAGTVRKRKEYEQPIPVPYERGF